MNTQESPKDKYEIPRCQYVSAIGSRCDTPAMTGEHFCFLHKARIAERAEAQRYGGFNRREPEPPPRIPPNLPIITVRTHSDVILLYEDTINSVRQGEMDVRVANCLGNLAMGALSTINSGIRTERQAWLDEQKAAEKARQAETAAKKEAEAAPNAAEKASTETEDHETAKEAQKIQEAPSPAPSANGFVGRDQYGRKRRIIYRSTATGPEFVSTTTARPPLIVSQTGSTRP